jgi:hypothetical protein
MKIYGEFTLLGTRTEAFEHLAWARELFICALKDSAPKWLHTWAGWPDKNAPARPNVALARFHSKPQNQEPAE